MKKLKWGQIYPIVLIFAMYVVYEYRKHNKETEVEDWEQLHANRKTIKGKTMGTTYTIVYYDSLNRAVKPSVDSLLTGFSQYLSTYIPTSDISKFNQQNQLETLSPYLHTVLKKSKEIYQLSKGAFDPTVMPLVNLWGFGYQKTTTFPDTSLVMETRKSVGFDKIKFTKTTLSSPEGMELGFGAIAKGYGVDLVGQLLDKKGITTYLIEIGGENLTKGLKPDGVKWTLRILYPEKQRAMGQEAYCYVQLQDKAMATSGPYMQQKEIGGIKYSHTIDPRTGFPVQQKLLSICVLADDCMTADALATALNVLSIEEAKQFFQEHTQYDGMLLYSDEKGEIKEFSTQGFEAIKLKQ